jgi:hypothetical protein
MVVLEDTEILLKLFSQYSYGGFRRDYKNYFVNIKLVVMFLF